MKYKAFSVLSAAGLILAFVSASALADALPDLGDTSAVDVPPALERQVGEAQMNEIRLRERRYLDDPELTDYLNRLAQRLVAAGDARHAQVELFALDDPAINAFAMFGGFIGVNTGLIVAARSEAELAGVIAHEIAHVTQRHLARQIAQQRQLAVGSMLAVAVAILAARSNTDVANAALATSQAAGIQAQLSFSRDHEREADRVGFEMMQRAGIDGSGMVTFFQRLQQAGRAHESNAPTYLRTHPLTLDRITDLEHRVVQSAGLRERPAAKNGEFRLLQAKLEAMRAQPADALREARRQQAQAGGDPVAAYRLAVALLRSHEYGAAEQVLAGADPGSPLVARLAAEIALASGRADLAEQRYRRALAVHPERIALSYGLADTLIAGRRFQEAVSFLEAQARRHATDPSIHERLARAYEGFGRIASRHRAQAEAYLLRGQLPAAIDQLELAQRAGAADFVEQSIIDARLRELRRRQTDLASERRQ
jgi:predicted Zn-dependent protease